LGPGLALDSGLGRRFRTLVVGDDMGLNLVMIVLGLAASAAGLSAKNQTASFLAPLGWVLVLAGTVRLFVPGFF